MAPPRRALSGGAMAPLAPPVRSPLVRERYATLVYNVGAYQPPKKSVSATFIRTNSELFQTYKFLLVTTFVINFNESLIMFFMKMFPLLDS